MSRVALNLGCTRGTIENYRDRYVAVRKALYQADETVTDNAEIQHRSLIDRGYWPAIEYRLRTKGKKRGYVERVEQQIEGRMVVVSWDDATNPSED